MFRKKEKTNQTNGNGDLAQVGLNGNGNGASDAIVHIEDVHKSFVMGKEAVPALRGITLDVHRGEILCLMGPSGSGKTTLLNILGGLDTPSRGHVIVDGQNVVSLSEEKLARLRLRKMGFVFQNFNLLSSFTALENVQVPMVLVGKKDSQRAKELLRLVGLGDRMGHYPSELSGGQQQRVAIARALANDPPLIIGDEMTGDLDTETSYEIMNLLDQLNKDRGTTVVYVTHDPRMSKFANRVINMRDGKLQEDKVNDTRPILRQAQDDRTKYGEPVEPRLLQQAQDDPSTAAEYSVAQDDRSNHGELVEPHGERAEYSAVEPHGERTLREAVKPVPSGNSNRVTSGIV